MTLTISAPCFFPGTTLRKKKIIVYVPDREEEWGDCPKTDTFSVSSLKSHDITLTLPCLLFTPLFVIVVQL